MNRKKFAFFAMTEYQLLNILKFVWNDIEGSKNNSDLYISEDVISKYLPHDNIVKANIFSNIFIVSKITYNSNRRLRKLQSLVRTVNNSAFGKYLTPDGQIYAKDVKYDVIVVSSSALVFEMCMHYFKHDSLYYIEDGSGNYIGGVKSLATSKSRAFVQKILFKSEPIKKMYVNKMELCDVNEAQELCSIEGKPETEFMDFLQNIFCNDAIELLYEKDDAIFLDRPEATFTETQVYKNNEIKDLCFEYFGESFIQRRHPRDRSLPSKYKRNDNRTIMWEYVCKEEITDNSVLLGYFSTAQITPKILYNKEPYIIFLYKMYGKQETIQVERFIERFKACYEKDAKIFIPSDMAELESALKRIMSNE